MARKKKSAIVEQTPEITPESTHPEPLAEQPVEGVAEPPAAPGEIVSIAPEPSPPPAASVEPGKITIGPGFNSAKEVFEAIASAPTPPAQPTSPPRRKLNTGTPPPAQPRPSTLPPPAVNAGPTARKFKCVAACRWNDVPYNAGEIVEVRGAKAVPASYFVEIK